MVILVYGGSGSGKSTYAEECMLEIAKQGNKYYVATMQVYGEEGRKKVQRHRMLRAGKGFSTIEQPKDVASIIEKYDLKESSVLLECMSNLVANEMFMENEIKNPNEVRDKVVRDVEVLRNNVKNLVIVSNNVFEDGISYDETTRGYIRAMGMIHMKLANMADQVVEVVVGIPLPIKDFTEGRLNK